MNVESPVENHEDRLRARMLAAVFEHDSELVLVVDSDSILLHASADFVEVLDAPRQTWPGRPIRDLLAAIQVSREDVVTLEGVCGHTGRDEKRILLRYVHSVEGHRCLEGRVYRSDYVDSENAGALSVLVFHDVTRGWYDLIETAESEARYRTIASASRDIVTETDERGLFTYVNATCFEVLGYQPAELEGTIALELHHELDIDAFRRELRSDLEPGDVIRVSPHRLRHRNGSWLWFEATGVRYERSDGETRTIGVAREITARIEAEEEQRVLEEQLLRSQKLESLGVLAGGIAHDFNNKLGIMLLGLDTLLAESRAETEEGSSIRDDLLRIRKGVLQSSALAKKLLLLGEHRPRKTEPLLINSQVGEAAEMMSRLLGAEIRFAIDLQADLWPIKGETASIDQIVTNLSINGRDAMPEGGRLLIETRNVVLDAANAARQLGAKAGRFVRIRVADTGEGMDESVQSLIYDPFFTTKNTPQNSGLGLSIVQRSVHAHDGWIELESAVGKGSRFDIYLPAYPDELVDQSSTRAPTAAPVDGVHERILLLEDEEELRDSLQKVLEGEGYVVDAFGDLESARAAFGACHFDLIMTDMRLPDGRGTKLVADALARDEGIGRIVMSGFSDDDEDSELSTSPSTSFLHKPFSLVELLSEVRRQLSGGESSSETNPPGC